MPANPTGKSVKFTEYMSQTGQPLKQLVSTESTSSQAGICFVSRLDYFSFKTVTTMWDDVIFVLLPVALLTYPVGH